MGYKGILRRSWEVTWKYKILWLFGLFAGSSFGSNSRTTTYTSPAGSTTTQAQMQAALADAHALANTWVSQAQLVYQQYAPLIWLGLWIALLIIIAIVVVSVAARGGLVHLANEADEGRPVRAGAGWRVGFAKWWRVFGVGFLASLPMILLALIFSGVVAVAVVAWLRSPTPLSLGPDIISTFIVAACGLFVLTVIGIFLGITLGIASELGLRYAVLNDRGALDSLKQGWRDLWTKRGAFKLFAIQLGLGILFAIAMGIVGSILAGPNLVVSTAAGVRVANPAGAGLTFLLIVPAAVYAAFYSVVWTLFFRRMTGMQPEAAAAPMPAPSMPMAPAPVPPMPEPPAPPMPEPPAPPAPMVSDV
jgi:hypothetical protein